MASSFRELIAYKKAYVLSLKIHEMSLTMPKIEQVELAGQLRRASKSVCLNIAEGFSRKDTSLAEFKRFLVMARSSCDEMRCGLDYCRDLNYIDLNTHKNLELAYVEVGKILTSMIKTWKF